MKLQKVWGMWDSNPHKDFSLQILSLLRLNQVAPIPHLPKTLSQLHLLTVILSVCYCFFIDKEQGRFLPLNLYFVFNFNIAKILFFLLISKFFLLNFLYYIFASLFNFNTAKIIYLYILSKFLLLKNVIRKTILN